ncbi:MAG: hypothetical protein QXW35_05255 [Candidatus Aenigmatarchaeota archaeon]
MKSQNNFKLKILKDLFWDYDSSQNITGIYGNYVMELKKKKLLEEHKKAIEKIGKMPKEGDFYLAGGTGVYYHLRHRHSGDLDFFTNKGIDFREFLFFFEPEDIKLLTKDTIYAKVNNINLSFFQYPYPLLKPPNYLEIIKLQVWKIFYV